MDKKKIKIEYDVFNHHAGNTETGCSGCKESGLDIEEISGPKVPSGVPSPQRKKALKPVNRISSLSPVHSEENGGDHFDDWFIKDKVTISPKARRKYQQMRGRRPVSG